MHQFLKFILEWNSTCFGQFLCPSSGVIHCTHSNGICHTGLLIASYQQTCMTYTIAVCIVNNSWWWTEELSETRRVSFRNKFEKLVHLVGFIIRFYYKEIQQWCMSYRFAGSLLSANLYDIYHCCAHSELLLMMDRGTVRNM